MTSIKEILKDAKFDDWREAEQSALSRMMANTARGRSNEYVECKTARVNTTFIRILNTHLPEQKTHGEVMQ